MIHFDLGNIMMTPGAIEALEDASESVVDILARHIKLDQGDLCDEDHQLNLEAVAKGSRILSSYRLSTGKRIWVISEADRSSTTLLLPEEY